MKASVLAAVFAGAVIGHAVPIYAQSYPERPIRLIVMGQPGGGVDFGARLVAPHLSRSLGQPIVIDNRAGEVVAGETVARAAPNGYTLLMNGSSLLFLPLMRENVPYDMVKSFAPITLAHQSPNVLVVHPSLPARSVSELLALAKAKPGELDFASAGTGSSTHLAAQLFKVSAGIDIVHVPYKSSAAALTALTGGHVRFMFGTPGSVAPHIASGRLRALAVTTRQPTALFPGLPTVAASGLPGFECVSTNGMLAPAGTPAAIVDKLNREAVRVLRLPEVKERFFSAGSEVIASTPAEFTATIKSEIAKWGKIIKGAGIRAD